MNRLFPIHTPTILYFPFEIDVEDRAIMREILEPRLDVSHVHLSGEMETESIIRYEMFVLHYVSGVLR